MGDGFSPIIKNAQKLRMRVDQNLKVQTTAFLTCCFNCEQEPSRSDYSNIHLSFVLNVSNDEIKYLSDS